MRLFRIIPSILAQVKEKKEKKLLNATERKIIISSTRIKLLYRDHGI